MIKKIEVLIKMQKIDSKIKELEKKVKILPQKLSNLEENVKNTAKKLEESENQLKENLVEQNNKKLLIKQNNDKIAKFKNQLLQIKNNKEYKALNSEITFLEKENERIDDETLELMLKADEIRVAIEKNKAKKKVAETELNKNKDKLNNEIAEVESQIKLLKEKRREIAQDLDRATLKRYVSLIKAKGSAVVHCEKNACGGCGIRLRPQLLIDISKGDKVYSCEYCGRIIVSKHDFETVKVEF